MQVDAGKIRPIQRQDFLEAFRVVGGLRREKNGSARRR